MVNIDNIFVCSAIASHAVFIQFSPKLSSEFSPLKHVYCSLLCIVQLTYDKVRDSSRVWLPKGWKNKNGQNIKQNMFSRLKFSVDFISEVKNT